MINIIKTKLTNKTDSKYIYYIGGSRITLEPKGSVTIMGDIFSRETKQEGNTENLLVNVYNGNIDFTLIIDDKFISSVERANVVNLPQRSKSRLIDKSAKPAEAKKEAPKPVEVKKEEVKPVEVKKEEPKAPVKPVVKEEPKKEPAKPVEVKKEEKPVEATLDNVTVNDAKPKKAAKL